MSDSTYQLPDSEQPILFFDGVCNLCDGFVQKIIKNDSKELFRFSSLQSGTGTSLLRFINEKEGTVPDSLILLYKGQYYKKSDAVLKVGKLLGGKWSLIAAGKIIPAFIRDLMYDFVAKNRYKWFGKQDNCMIPTPELKTRFLD